MLHLSLFLFLIHLTYITSSNTSCPDTVCPAVVVPLPTSCIVRMNDTIPTDICSCVYNTCVCGWSCSFPSSSGGVVEICASNQTIVNCLVEPCSIAKCQYGCTNNYCIGCDAMCMEKPYVPGFSSSSGSGISRNASCTCIQNNNCYPVGAIVQPGEKAECATAWCGQDGRIAVASPTLDWWLRCTSCTAGQTNPLNENRLCTCDSSTNKWDCNNTIPNNCSVHNCLIDPCAATTCATGTYCLADYCGGCRAMCIDPHTNSSSGSSPNTCTYGTITYSIGSSFPSLDGCNSCTCSRININQTAITCTTRACDTCTQGQTKRAEDGCNTCTCTEQSQWACTLMGCDGSGVKLNITGTATRATTTTSLVWIGSFIMMTISMLFEISTIV